MNLNNQSNFGPNDHFRRLRGPTNLNKQSRSQSPTSEGEATEHSDAPDRSNTSATSPFPSLDIVRKVAHTVRFLAFKFIEESPPAVHEVGFHIRHYPEMNAGGFLTTATKAVYLLEAEMQKRSGLSEEEVSFRSAAGGLQAILHGFVRDARAHGIVETVPTQLSDEFRRSALQLRIELNTFLVQLDGALLSIIAATRSRKDAQNN